MSIGNGRVVSYGLLVASSAMLACLLERLGLPAGLLIGPMLAAIAFAALGTGITLARPLSVAGQAIVGLLIATTFSSTLLRTVASELLLFGGVTAATLAISVAAGVVLARSGAVPGTAAIWGSMPGAGTAMTLMAR